MYTYDDFAQAVEVLWPNVQNIDLFLEKLTDEQVHLIATYLQAKSLDIQPSMRYSDITLL